MNLAKNLLRNGDSERALQFADPVLSNVTISTLDFLTLLREKNPATADQRYAAMLANTGGNLAADANTISLLSSYIFTPQTYVVFNTDGAASHAAAPTTSPANVSPQLRLAFFQTAGTRFTSTPTSTRAADQSTAGIAGKYMIVKRLLPLFEQYAPKDITESLRGQFEALSSLVSASVRQGRNRCSTKRHRS